AYMTRNKKKLMKIYHDNIYYEIEEDYFIALAAKACYEKLDVEEKTQLETFFNNCEMWSRYELNLFINVMPQIDQNLTLSIINKLSLSKYEYLRERREYRPLFARLIVKIILLLITQGMQKEAEGLIKYLKGLPPIIDITEKVVGMFLEGCCIYKFEDSQMGNKIVRRSLRILLDVEAIELKNILEFYYKNTINSKKKSYLLIN
ncbi:Rgg/GadR/MutR family transcriptional regulator, partial [Lactococcus petauri]